MTDGLVEGFHLSPQQRRLWSVRRDGDEPYNACCLVRIDGALDRGALRAALARTVERHEILRTRFRALPGMNAPLQVIAAAESAQVEERSLRSVSAEEQERLLHDLFARAKGHVFDLERGPQLGATLVELNDDSSALLLVTPALCADLTGLEVLVRDLAQVYAAGLHAEEPPAAGPQYADLSEWQLQLLESPGAAPALQRWRADDGAAAPRRPLADASAGGFRPRALSVQVAAPVERRLADVSAGHDLAPSATLNTCWRVLLHRLGVLDHDVLGVAHDGRRYEELKSVPGLLAAYLPERVPVQLEAPWLELTRRSALATREADKWQEFWTADEASYFAHCFEHVEQAGVVEAAGVSFTLERESVCFDRFDLKLVCARRGGALRAELFYDSVRYERGEVERLAERWKILLADALEHPEKVVGELELLGESERSQVLDSWSGNRRAYAPVPLVPHWIAAWMALHPERPAVEHESESLTYGELDRRSKLVANRLRALGLGSESRVGLCVPRSLEMVVGLLGILRSGAACVPLDPSHPAERLAFLLADSGAEPLLSLHELVPRLPSWPGRVLCLDKPEEWAACDQAEPEPALDPRQLAYLVYTSGSMGRPKGVAVEHRQLLNYVQGIVERLQPEPGSRFGLVSTYAADLGYTMLYPALCTGGCLEVASEERAGDAAALAELFESRPVDYLKIVPSHLRALLSGARPERLLPRRGLVMGGEACGWDLVARLRELAPDVALWNHYGPTETTVGVLSGEVLAEASATVPLGRPLGNAEVYLLDTWMRPVPVGVMGEMYLGGAGVARGYLGQPDRTAERFVPHPFADGGERLYRSGDLGRWLEGGAVEFLGRADDQVKIRGYRVELGEIEAALRDHGSVRDAVVVARDIGPGEQRQLVAYVTTPDGGEAAGRPRYSLPNGMAILHQNRAETEYQYLEIFEQQSYLRLGARLGPDGCVLDVGANIGMFALFASQCCPAGRVYAFEPIDELGETLLANTARYGANVHVYTHGLGAREERREFTYYPRYSMFSGLTAYAMEKSEKALVRSFLEPLLAGAGGEGEDLRLQTEELVEAQLGKRTEVCRLRPLSAIVREEGLERIDLLKIDVQGAEQEVLEGIADEHWGRIRQIVLEVHDDSPDNRRLGEVRALLERRGLRVVVGQSERPGGRHEVYAVRPEEEGALAAWGRPAGMPLPAVSREAEEASGAALRRFLTTRLPNYMIPQAIVTLARLPLTANGKLDRQALPAPQPTDSERPVRRLNPTEEIIAAVWSEVLQRPELVGPEQNFFELGGHSLLATQVTSRLRGALGLEVPVVWLFDTPTVAGLAARIERRRREQEDLLPPPLIPVPRGRPLPLSFAQQRLWFLDQWNPGSAFYNVDSAVRIGGNLSVAALERTLNLLVRRHETLRTIFPAEQGSPLQVILPELRLEVPVRDLSGLPESRREAAALELVVAGARQPFDLARGPLLRVEVTRLAADNHVLMLSMHHIVSDGWSNGIMIAELVSFYEACSAGTTPTLAPLAVQYGDYACWQRGWLQGEVLESQLAYWRKQLEDAPPSLDLRTDHPRPALQRFRGLRRAVDLAPELVAEVRALARRNRVTLFMLLLAAFQVLLRHYTDRNRIAVGTNSANRNRLEIEGIIGFFINQLVLLGDLSGSPSFAVLLARVRTMVLGAFDHQELPFEQLVAELRPDRGASQSPLYQVLFTLQPPQEERSTPAGLAFQAFPIPHAAAKFDLVLTMVDRGSTMSASFEYDVDLFKESTIGRMLGHFTRILRDVVADPEVSIDTLLARLAAADAEELAQQAQELSSSDLERLGALKRPRGGAGVQPVLPFAKDMAT